MSGNTLVDAGIFLVDALFGLVVFVVMLRFLMYFFRISFHDSAAKFLLNVTTPLLRPLYTFVPGWRNVDFAALILMISLEIIKFILIYLFVGHSISIIGIFLNSIVSLLSLLINIFFFAIIIQVILSWVSSGSAYNSNPLSYLIYHLTEPLLAPARRALPNFQGFDFSPIFVLLGLQLVTILLVNPLQSIANAF